MLAVYGANSEYGANDPLRCYWYLHEVFTIVLSIAATGIIIGAQAILGYNIGAGQFDRVRETFRKVPRPPSSSVLSRHLFSRFCIAESILLPSIHAQTTSRLLADPHHQL